MIQPSLTLPGKLGARTFANHSALKGWLKESGARARGEQRALLLDRHGDPWLVFLDAVEDRWCMVGLKPEDEDSVWEQALVAKSSFVKAAGGRAWPMVLVADPDEMASLARSARDALTLVANELRDYGGKAAVGEYLDSGLVP